MIDNENYKEILILTYHLVKIQKFNNTCSWCIFSKLAFSYIPDGNVQWYGYSVN